MAAGKGTIAELLSIIFNLRHLSSGDLLRELLAEPTTDENHEMQDRVREGMANKLVNDDDTIYIIKRRMQKHIDEGTCGNGFIFDGFPRTVAQAEKLDAMLEELGTSIAGCLEVNTTEEECLTRSLKRGQEAGADAREEDLNPEKARVKIRQYFEEIRFIAFYYAAKKILFQVNGMQGKSLMQEEAGSICFELFQKITGEIEQKVKNQVSTLKQLIEDVGGIEKLGKEALLKQLRKFAEV